MIWQDLRLYGAGAVATPQPARGSRVTGTAWQSRSTTVTGTVAPACLRYGSGCYPDSGYCRRFSSSGSSAGHRRSRPGPVLRLRVTAVTARSGEICRATGRGGAAPDCQASVLGSVVPKTVTFAVRSIQLEVRSRPPG